MSKSIGVTGEYETGKLGLIILFVIAIIALIACELSILDISLASKTNYFYEEIVETNNESEAIEEVVKQEE